MSEKKYTANEVDAAYFMGVFNVGGIDGLADEAKRIKELGIMPHKFLETLSTPTQTEGEG